MKRGFLSTPGINLEKLGLAPPSKVNAALPTMRLTDLVTRAHSAIMASEQKSKSKLELIRARKEYEHELKMAKEYGYIEGKNRIPKKLPIKRKR
jgi:hypothetical protein